MLSTPSLHAFTDVSLHILQGKDESWSVGAPQKYHIHVHGDIWIFLNLIACFFCILDHCISEIYAKLLTAIHHIQLTVNITNTYSCGVWNNPTLSQNKDTPEKWRGNIFKIIYFKYLNILKPLKFQWKFWIQVLIIARCRSSVRKG